MTAITKFCPKCKLDVPIADWYKNVGRRDGLSAYCRPCYIVINDELRKRRRHELIVALGGVCVRCGFSDERALQVDHVNGGGLEVDGTARAGAHWAKKVLANRAEYQLLCANCNMIKRIENEEHVGRREYARSVPTERIVPPSQRFTPETNARRGAAVKKHFATVDPEQQRERNEKIAAAHRGTKLINGHWVKPD